MKKSRDERKKKLDVLEKYYKKICSPNITETTWKEELKELDVVITKHSKDWLYMERKTYN